MHQQLAVAAAVFFGEDFRCPGHQLHQRQEKSDDQDAPAVGAGHPASPAAQAHRLLRPVAASRGEAHPRTHALFDHQHHQHEDDQDRSELGGRGQGEEAEPGLVDGGGEGVVVEDGDGAEIGQRLHQDQHQPGDDPGTGHRQRHAPEGRCRRGAEGARRLDHAHALGGEGVARQQEHVGVEYQREDEGDAGRRTDVGQAEVASEELASRGGDRPGEVEDTEEHEGQHVGGHRHRQQQRPPEHAASRKIVDGGEPAQADAEQRGAEQHAQHQLAGVRQQVEQEGVGQVVPDLAGLVPPREKNHRHGGDDQRGNGESAQAPSIEGAQDAAKAGGEVALSSLCGS